MRTHLLHALLIILPTAFLGADGTIDTTFGTNGQLVGTQAGSTMVLATYIAPDSSITVAGANANPNGRFFAAQYTSNGAATPNFSVVLPAFATGSTDSANALVQQPDGKFILGGSTSTTTGSTTTSQFALARISATGTLDTSFGTTGQIVASAFPAGTTGQINGLALQADGKIVAVGSIQMLSTSGTQHFGIIARYLANGSLDTTFNASGTTPGMIQSMGQENATCVAIDSAGNILVGAGTFTSATQVVFSAVRYTPSGALDVTFGEAGKATSGPLQPLSNDLPNAIAIQPNGSIVLAGISAIGSTNSFALVRYTTAGLPDMSFNGTSSIVLPHFSTGSSDLAYALNIQNDGKLIISGYTQPSSAADAFALARLNTNGTLDTSFGTAGTGQVIVPGFSTNSNDQGRAAALQSNIILAGTSFAITTGRVALTRYTSSPALNQPTARVSVTGNTVNITGTAENLSTMGFVLNGVQQAGAYTTGAAQPGSYSGSFSAANGTYTLNVVGEYQAGKVNLQNTQTITVNNTIILLAPVITSPANNSTTSSTEPTISGTAPAGATITVFAQSNLPGAPVITLGTTVANSTGSWIFSAPNYSQPLAVGTTYRFTAQASLNGSVSAQSLPVTVTIALSAPVITSPANNTSTTNTIVTLQGTTTTGSTVQVFANGLALGNATVTGTSWRFTTQPLQVGSTYSFTAQATLNGTTSAQSAPAVTVTITSSSIVPPAPQLTSVTPRSTYLLSTSPSGEVGLALLTYNDTPVVGSADDTLTATNGMVVGLLLTTSSPTKAVATTERLTAIAPGAQVSSNLLVVTGTGTAGATVNLSVNQNTSDLTSTSGNSTDLLSSTSGNSTDLLSATSSNTTDLLVSSTGTTRKKSISRAINDGVIATTTVGHDGTWSISSADFASEINSGFYNFVATQTTNGGTSSPSTPVPIFVVDSLCAAQGTISALSFAILLKYCQ